MKRKANIVVITTHGSDGACSAAMLLQKYPDARLFVTSTSRLADTLKGLQNSKIKYDKIHICGVGYDSESIALNKVLPEIESGESSMTWYCGRSYLDEYKPELSLFCNTVFKVCSSNTEVIFGYLKIKKDKTASLLLQLAEQFVERQSQIPEDHLWWHDFIQSSAARYFKYEDSGAFLTCIKKLAGLQEITPNDKFEIIKWRNSQTKALPLGSSPAMKRLRAMVKRLAPLDEPVLLGGESGSGKEVIARLLHDASLRTDGPFIPVNCAILSTSSDLAHDRLFGHKAGAYTGAKEDGQGAFEMADDGTLFLDEVAELPLDVQTQLLRVLEESTILPLGTMEAKQVNVRVIAATNQNIPLLIENGKFRLDLYHRLNVLSLNVPPLRERLEDMKSIANAVIHRLKEKGHKLKIEKSDWQTINSYNWPGNIRQFINILKRAAYMKITVTKALNEEIIKSSTSASITPAIASTLFHPADMDSITPESEVRKAYMQHCLNLCDQNWTLTAHKLGIAANTLRKWLDEK